MRGGTLFGILLTPVFYCVVVRLLGLKAAATPDDGLQAVTGAAAIDGHTGASQRPKGAVVASPKL
jgi:hypothetical protein